LSRRARLAAIGALVLILGGRAATAGQARVTYLAGGSVYVDAGRLEGLGEGDTLTVSRDGRPIGRLRVTFLSSHRASCDTLGLALPVQPGDLAEFRARARSAASTADTLVSAPAADSMSAPAVPSPRPRSRWAPRGRIGFRYLGVQSDAALGDFRQPGLDLRLDAPKLGGAPLDLAVDARAHRSSWSGAGDTLALPSETRVYRLALDWHDASGFRHLKLGRQSSPSFSSVSLFDGALAEIGGPRWSAGLFSGTQPAPLGLGLSSDILEFGAAAGWRAPVGAERRWRVDLGGVSSQQNGQPNRDFLFLQALYQDRRFTWTGTQEVDVNRGWRTAAGSTLSPTSSFLLARVQVIQALALRAGFDNRRSVRLYRDRLTPETEFDDRYRMGAWGGASLDLLRHLRFDGDYRRRDGGVSDRSNTWTGSVEVYRLGPVNGVLRARVSRFDGAPSRSDLASVALGLDPTSGFHLEASGGSRNTRDELAQVEERVRWEAVDLDLALALRWYLVASYERDRGDLERLDQLQAGLSWRF
jgi:hypothetical protein